MNEALQEFLNPLMHPIGLFGLVGQCAFFSRFFVQWIASEKKGESIVPIAFWYLSLIGGIMLLTYAVWQRDPVITLGQSVGLLVYVRNLTLIYRSRALRRKEAEELAETFD
jgi:lipid-A-disaccharide synthase-like uncharacterized protein